MPNLKPRNHTRDLVVMALQTLNGAGTADQILDLVARDIGGDSPRKAVSVSLHWLETDDIVWKDEKTGIYTLTEYRKPPQAPSVTNGMAREGTRVDIAPFMKGRDPKTVTVYTSPATYDQVVGVQMCIHGQWIKFPVFGHVRICIGPEIPKWSPDQETNRNVTAIRLIHKTGDVKEIPVNASVPVTYDLEE